MNMILTAVALTIAIPTVASAQAMDCCKTMKMDCCKDGKADCCKDMKGKMHDGAMKGMKMPGDHQMSGDAHAAHNMGTSSPPAQQPQH